MTVKTVGCGSYYVCNWCMNPPTAVSNQKALFAGTTSEKVLMHVSYLFEAKYTYLQGCWADAASLLPPFSKARGARNEKSKRSLGYYLVIANDVLNGVIQIQNVGLLLKQLDSLVDPLVTPRSEDKATIPPLTSPAVRLSQIV